MPSRRDQVQAQSYVLGRLTSALVMGEPEAPENPHRRVVVGTLAGLLIGALVIAGFTVYGMLRPGAANGWRKPGVLIIEKEIGTRYLFLGGALRPVLNYASALLILGAAKPETVTVSTASLRSAPRGLPLGIVGAPDALPSPTGLHGTAWTVCTVSSSDNSPLTTLSVNRLPATKPLAEDEALVASAGGRTYLLWQEQRIAIAQEWVVRALGYQGAAVPVQPGWLDQLPAGPDLAPIPVPGRGEPGPEIDRHPSTVGQIFVTKLPGTAERYYLLQRDGLVQLSAMAMVLLSSDPQTVTAYGDRPVVPIQLSAGAATALPTSSAALLDKSLPNTPPRLATLASGHSWCIRVSGVEGQIQVTAEPAPLGAIVTRDGIGVTRNGQTATALAIEPGAGGLVYSGGWFLIIDAGVKFPLPSDKVASAMGYPPATAAVLQPQLLALLPTGPVLDPAQALSTKGTSK